MENSPLYYLSMTGSNTFLIQGATGFLHLCGVGAAVIYCYRAGGNPNNKTNTLALLVLIGFILAVIKHYILGAYFRLSYPYNTFLFNSEDRFNDYFNMLRACKDNNPYFTSYWLKSVYFPAANTVFYVFGLIRNEWVSFCTYTFIFLATYFCFMRYSNFPKNSLDSTRDFLIITCLTYPVLFSLDRSNLDIYIFLIIFGFVMLFQRGYFILSSLLLSFAIAMKLYPLVFVSLFIKEKKYKEISYIIIATLIISIFCLMSYQGGFSANLDGMISAFKGFNQDYSGGAGLQHNVSYYGVLKLATMGYYYAVHGIRDLATVSTIANEVLRIPYLFLVGLIFAFVIVYVLKYEQALWKNVYLLSASMVLLPHVSFDYKLIHMLIPTMLYLSEESPCSFDKMYVILFGILLIPNNYIYIRGDISIAVFIYPTIMTALAIMMISECLLYQKRCQGSMVSE